VSFLKLMEHSVRILSVFKMEILLTSSIYTIIFIFFIKKLTIMFLFFCLILNLTIFFFEKKHKTKNIKNFFY